MEAHGTEALAERFEAALGRIGAYFMGSSPVQDAAARIARLLGELKVDYAIAGALCLAAHGVVRATEDVDGKPKPVQFPPARQAGIDAGRFRVVALKHFVEMKLASGMTAPHRLQDLADVLRLIAVAKLPRELAQDLDPYVRAKYEELWETAQRPEDDY